MDMEDSFSLSGQSLSCPSSASQSFSSASSSYGPFTPSSGRSTPAQRPASMTLDTSFYSTESNPFDMTPPSSAVSTYFPGEEFIPDGAPLTPSRYGNMLDATLASHTCMGQFTPSQQMEMYSFADGMNPSPFMIPTPHSVQGSTDFNVAGSMWCGFDESPMDLFDKSAVLLSSGKEEMMPPMFGGFRRKLYVDEVQQKTSALQRAQQQSAAQRMGMKRERESRTLVPGSNIAVQRIVAGTFKCDAPGCSSRPFKRMEHLKRHKFTCHNPIVENFQCQYCVHKFNRRDNWRQHLKLHTQKRGRSSRTDYYAEAVKEYEDEMRRIKQRRPCKAKLRAAALAGRNP